MYYAQIDSDIDALLYHNKIQLNPPSPQRNWPSLLSPRSTLPLPPKIGPSFLLDPKNRHPPSLQKNQHWPVSPRARLHQGKLEAKAKKIKV